MVIFKNGIHFGISCSELCDFVNGGTLILQERNYFVFSCKPRNPLTAVGISMADVSLCIIILKLVIDYENMMCFTNNQST